MALYQTDRLYRLRIEFDPADGTTPTLVETLTNVTVREVGSPDVVATDSRHATFPPDDPTLVAAIAAVLARLAELTLETVPQ